MLEKLLITLGETSNFVHQLIAIFVMVAILLLVGFIKIWALGPMCKIQKDLTGKIVFITGGSTGIGKETALELARREATVVMGCRSKDRAEAAINDIRLTIPGANIEFIELDLANLTSVRDCAANFLDRYNRLDILINNAAVMALPERRLTADGFEMQLGTNHLGHFLLTHLLMGVLNRSAASRIINVSAKLGEKYKIEWDNLQLERNYSGLRAYRQSKMANILHAKELAVRCNASKVKACSLHPGVIPTELGRYMTEKWYAKILWCICYPIFWLFTKSRYTGAQTTINCAVVDHAQLSNGGYYKDCKEKQLAGEAFDSSNASKLWSVSEELVGIAGKKEVNLETGPVSSTFDIKASHAQSSELL